MDLLILPIGSIIVFAGVACTPPPGLVDITGSIECIEHIDHFQRAYPNAGEFVSRDPLFCIKRVEPVPIS
jgi:hypothetical protein